MRRILVFLFFVAVCSSNGRSQFVWSAQNSGLSAEAIKDVFFLDLNKGWAVGQSGKILHTVDGGQTWVQLSAPVTEDLYGVCMSTNSIGWIVGANETLLKTTDGGNTWNSASPPSGTSSHLYTVQFVDENHGWITGFWDNFRTTDGGATWEVFHPISSTMWDAHFISPLKGWICGVASYIGYTVDGGVTWTPAVPPTAADMYTLYVNGDMSSVTVAGSGGFIYQTTNFGSSWDQVNVSAPGALLDIDFLNSQVGLAVGNSGTVLSTQNGGLSWSSNVFASYDFTATDLVADGTGWVVGYAGSIFKSAYGQNDLSVEDYIGLDTLCINVETEVGLTVYNAGPAPITEADFVLFDGSTDFHTFHWTGFLAGGAYLDINLGAVSVNHAGTYSCVISGDSVETNNISYKQIAVVANPVSTSLPSTICPGDSVEIGVSGGIKYDWFNASSDTTSATQLVAPVETQTYYVAASSQYCQVLDSVTVFVEDCTAPVTAISPNGDGTNDVLVISEIKNTDNFLKVYNRWGDVVNSFTNYDNETVAWDGTDSFGNPLMEGTYYYIFETVDQSQRIKSWVQIVR